MGLFGPSKHQQFENERREAEQKLKPMLSIDFDDEDSDKYLKYIDQAINRYESLHAPYYPEDFYAVRYLLINITNEKIVDILLPNRGEAGLNYDNNKDSHLTNKEYKFIMDLIISWRLDMMLDKNDVFRATLNNPGIFRLIKKGISEPKEVLALIAIFNAYVNEVINIELAQDEKSVIYDPELWEMARHDENTAMKIIECNKRLIGKPQREGILYKDGSLRRLDRIEKDIEKLEETGNISKPFNLMD